MARWHYAYRREDAAGWFAQCECGYEGKRRSVATDALLDANAHNKRHHAVLWYVRPGVKHQRSKQREAV